METLSTNSFLYFFSFDKNVEDFSFCRPLNLLCFLGHTSCYLFTNWQLSPPLVLSKLTPPPPPTPNPDSSKWNQWKVSMFPPTLTSFLRPLETFQHWDHFYDDGAGWVGGWGGAMTTTPVKSPPPLQYPHAPLQIKRWNLSTSKYPFNRTNNKEKCHKCRGNGHIVKMWNFFGLSKKIEVSVQMFNFKLLRIIC